MFVLIGIAFLLLYAALVYYIGWSGWRWIGPKASKTLKMLYIAAILVLALSFFLGQGFENVVLRIVGAYWMALFSLLLMVLPLTQATVLLLRLTRLPRHRVEKVSGAVALVGRKDRSEPDRLPVAQLTERADRSKPLILLDHQPYELQAAQEAGVDLSVSRHTHRGQVAPGHLITQRLYELDWGYLRKGSLHAIVTSGYGFWGPPIRIGSRAEIVRIEATFGTADTQE
jgi:predicted MPP superfamily phosphohydrolase